TVSKRRLLEWVNQAEVERLSGKSDAPALSGMYGGYVLIALMVAGIAMGENTAAQAIGFAFVLLWGLAPFAIRWLDQSPTRARESFTPQEAEELHRLSHDIWSFYEDYVTERDHWLPPDNVQIEPDKGIAHRT